MTYFGFGRVHHRETVEAADEYSAIGKANEQIKQRGMDFADEFKLLASKRKQCQRSAVCFGGNRLHWTWSARSSRRSQRSGSPARMHRMLRGPTNRALRQLEQRVAEAEKALAEAKEPRVLARYGDSVILYEDRLVTREGTLPLSPDIHAAG